MRHRIATKTAVLVAALLLLGGLARPSWADKGGRRRFSSKEMRIANLTSRSHGAVGKNAITPRVVRQGLAKQETVLDFGAGRDALHAQTLRSLGYKVTAHEFGDNAVPGVHDPKALERRYDVVYASNVLNVQSSRGMLDRTLAQIAGTVKPGGRFVGNYPGSPRKSGLKPSQVKSLLLKHFGEVRRVAGTSGAPVWEARQPKQKQQQQATTPKARSSREGTPGKRTSSKRTSSKRTSSKRTSRRGAEEIVVTTTKGTRIYRDRENGVGKRMGQDLYVHRQYASQVVPGVLLAAARSQLPADFRYTIVKYNAKTKTISFISSPDWDKAAEPSVGTAYTVHVDGRVKKTAAAGKIYHHKWLFVRDSYKGFNVAASVRRSRAWLALDNIDFARIQSAEYWKKNVVSRLR
ncbi:MAG: methyltransferase domain-containing protein [Myxococcales bacterium]|nr:methyltransferase domain-containing protein [Myxococcales bacterium]